MTKAKLFIVQVDRASQPSHCEEWILIWNDEIIHTGNWLYDTDTFVQGFIVGLQAAGYEVESVTYQIKNDAIYDEIQQGQYNLEKIALAAGVI